MDTESDTEEQLQKDILQINQVLGNDGDDDEEEDEDHEDDGTEFDHVGLGNVHRLQIVECEVTDEHDEDKVDNGNVVLPVSLSTSVGQDELAVEECPQEEPTDASSEGISLEQLLVINQENQQSLHGLLAKVQEELVRNQEEQDKVSANPNDTEQRNVDLSVRRVVKNYLLYAIGKTPPDNVDTKKRKAENMPTPFDIPLKKWKSHRIQKLTEGVKTDGMKRLMQPLLNRQEILEDKMDKLSVPEQLESVYQEVQEIKKKMTRIEKMPTKELLGDRFRNVDWAFISNVNLEGERTAEECQNYWQNSLHPSINHKEWTPKEDKHLMAIATRHELRNWEAIAEELGTNRTALQCLRRHQQLDKTFVNSEFTNAEDSLLVKLVERFQIGRRYIPFNKVAYFMEGKTPVIVSYRFSKRLDSSHKSGKWNDEEIKKLTMMVKKYGAKNWSRLADYFPGRTQFQIREKWVNRLNPGNKYGTWTYAETYEFLERMQEIGIGNWASIAEDLKKPGQKGRTPVSFLSRFKQVFAAYCKWLALYSRKKDGKERVAKMLTKEALYSGKFLPNLVAFLKKREEVEKLTALVRNEPPEKTKPGPRKRTGHKAKASSTDSSDDEEPSRHLTARQRAIALKKSQETTVKSPEQETNKEIEASGDEEVSEEDQQDSSDNNDSDDIVDDDTDISDSDYTGTPPSKRRKKEPHKPNKAPDVGMRGWMNNLKQEILDRADLGAAKGHLIIPAPYSTMLHVEGGVSIQELQEQKRNEKRRKQRERQQQLQQQRQQQQEQPEQQDEDQFDSVFDVSTSLDVVYKKRSGRPKFTQLDLQLFDAVDPQWLYRDKTHGRTTKQCVRAQERTGQGKLSRPDQRAMFRLLLQVFDVDVKYTTALATKSLAKRSKNDENPSAEGGSGKESEKTPEISTNTEEGCNSQGSGQQQLSGEQKTTAAKGRKNTEQETSSKSVTSGPNQNDQPVVNGEVNGMTTTPSSSASNPQTVQSNEANPSALRSTACTNETSNSQMLSSVDKLPAAGPQAHSGQATVNQPQGEQSSLLHHLLTNTSQQGSVTSTGGMPDAERVITTPQRAPVKEVNHAVSSGSKAVAPPAESASPKTLTVRQRLLQLRRGMRSKPYERNTTNTMVSSNCVVPQLQVGLQQRPQAGVVQSQSNAMLFQPPLLPKVGCPPNPTNIAPLVQAQCILLRNNQTGQLVLQLTPGTPMVGNPTPQIQGIANCQPVANPLATIAMPGASPNHLTPMLPMPQVPQVPSNAKTVPQQEIQPQFLIRTSPQVEAVTPGADPSQLVRLSLRDGSDVVITKDNFQSFKDGLLGNTTCNVSIPTSGMHATQEPDQQTLEPSPLNKTKMPSKTCQETSLPNAGQCGSQKKQEKQEKPRKLHTRDIVLLPPNVATLQGLVFLLLDRKNLESQQQKFISDRKKVWNRLQTEKLQKVGFSGYLASKSRGHGELSQPGITFHEGTLKHTAESAGSHQSVQHGPPEDLLASLRKTDMYQVLQKRFLSLFLWPGLLSSTRIKGTVDKKGVASYYSKEPLATVKIEQTVEGESST